MKHHKAIRKFGRERDERKALIRSLALSLVTHGKIRTTEAKAKELRPYVEKLITKGQEGTLASRKIIISRLGSADAAKKVIDEISPKYKERNGGYTRIIKMQARPGDASKMAVIEFV